MIWSTHVILVSDGDNELRIITLPHAPCHPSQFFRLLNKQAAAERHDIIANSTMQRTYAVFFCYLFLTSLTVLAKFSRI